MTEAKFTSDWFSQNIPIWTQIFQAAGWNDMSPRTIVEIGSYEGRSTIWSCQNLLRHPDSRIVCVDTFEGSVEHSNNQRDGIYDRFLYNIEATGVADKVIVRRGPSWKVLPDLIGENIQADMVYIDGSHQAPDVLEDAILAYRIVKKGGIILFDDYYWSVERHGQEDILNSPKLAIDMFYNIYRRRLKLFSHSRFQLSLQKTTE